MLLFSHYYIWEWNGSLPVHQSPYECFRHGGRMAAGFLEVTRCHIPGSLLKEDQAACTVTHKKSRSAKHTFSMDKDWITNLGQLCSILPALPARGLDVHPGTEPGGSTGLGRAGSRLGKTPSFQLITALLLNKAQLPAWGWSAVREVFPFAVTLYTRLVLLEFRSCDAWY